MIICIVASLLVVGAHTMNHFLASKHFNPAYYLTMLGLFFLCITYITLTICAEYTLSDPKVLISCGFGTTITAAAYSALLYRAEDLPAFKDLSPVFFGVPAVFLVVFTWILKWHSFATNGMIAIWLMIFGIFIWFETDFCREHKMKPRDNFLSLAFVYFEFLVFIYCVCSQLGDL